MLNYLNFLGFWATLILICMTVFSALALTNASTAILFLVTIVIGSLWLVVYLTQTS